SLMLEICRKMRELDAESDNYKWMPIGQPSPCRRGPVGTRAQPACNAHATCDRTDRKRHRAADL
ncbi:hypothetical protein M3583_22635, partial [Bacillus subtilis]|nr:hypothetical protein [Bacillus subtilis]